MRKRRMVLVLAVIAMTMAAMAPATAGGVSKTSLDNKDWSCFNNSPGGIGWHCSKTPINEFLDGGTGVLNLMVFEAPSGEVFLGTEILRFSARDIEGKPCGHNTTWHAGITGFDNLYACHHLH